MRCKQSASVRLLPHNELISNIETELLMRHAHMTSHNIGEVVETREELRRASERQYVCSERED